MLARFRFPLTVWAVTHATIIAIAGLTIYLWPYLYTAHGATAADIGPLDGLCAWDCLAYADLATKGYVRALDSNFWPMLSLYARPLVWLHASGQLAIVVVAQLASLVAYVSVYEVFLIFDGETGARWGLTFFVAYPFAFFFGVGYTETLMVAAGAGGMWLALRGRHTSAALAFAAGVLSRAPATLGWLGLAAVQLRDRTRWRTRAALLIPVAVGLLWPLYCWHRFGDPLQWMRSRHFWGWHAKLNIIRGFHFWREARMLAVYPFFGLIPAAGIIGLVRERRYWPLAAIALPTFVLFCVIGAYGFGRYSASVWPAFLPLGLWLSRRPTLQVPILVAMCLFQGFFLHMFAHAYELQ